MNSRLMLSTTVFSLLVTSFSQAAIITSPTTLNPGEQYRLAFVTSTTRDATSSDIADYDSFVQNAADAVPQLLSLGATWKAVGSTATVEARDNTDTNPDDSTGVPIFLLNDTKLADDNADLWDGSIDVNFDVTEMGTQIGDINVWTGTFFTGQRLTTAFLGGVGNVGSGRSGFTSSFWVRVNEFPSGDFDHPLYAISSVLTAVPEPSSCLVLLVGCCGMFSALRIR